MNLQLQQGERLLLVGPNGAGKSTFIRVFAGLMRATHGQALVFDQPAGAQRHLVGVVGHATFLYGELTAAENLALYASLYDVADASGRALALLESVGLQHLANERVERLSRGQQQRVAIARALLHDPPVLLLDEPDTGLDVAAFGLLETLVTGDTRSIVLTTHDLSAGVRLATRAAVLSRGRIVHAQDRLSSADVPHLGDMLQRLAAA